LIGVGPDYTGRGDKWGASDIDKYSGEKDRVCTNELLKKDNKTGVTCLPWVGTGWGMESWPDQGKLTIVYVDWAQKLKAAFRKLDDEL